MNTVIEVAKYYNNPAYFPYMPEPIFNALEAAFIAGEETTEVPKAEYELMLSEYARAEEA